MIAAPWDLLQAALALGLVGLLPGLPLTFALFPRLPLTQRLAIGAALSLAAPVLLETVLGTAAGVPVTAFAAWFWILLTAGAGLFLLVLRPPLDWRACLRAAPGTPRAVVAALVALLAVGAFLTYEPHLGFQLPFHVDEWTAYDAAATIARTGDVHLDHAPGFARAPELGFHVLLAHVQLATGIPWIPLLLVWPTFVFLLTMVALFAGTAPFGYGLETALLALALPTTVRVLGPQYVVPLALGLFLIPVAYTLFQAPDRRLGWAVLALLMAFVYLAHPPSAVAVAFLMLSYSAVTLRRNPRFALALVPLAVLPVLVGFLEMPRHITDPDNLLNVESRLPVPTFLSLFGLVPLALFFIGSYVALRTMQRERLGWFGTSLAHLGIISAFLMFHAGVTVIYDRAWMHGMLTMLVTAASGLAALRGALAVRLPARRLARVATAVAVAALVLAPSVSARAENEQGFYRVVTEENYQDFVWIRDHVSVPPWGKAALPTVQGTPFEAVTGLMPVARGWSYDQPKALFAFLYNGSQDEGYAQRNNVTIVYTIFPVNGALFSEVHPRVFARADVAGLPAT